MPIEDIRISLQLLTETVENLESEIDAREAAAKTVPLSKAPQSAASLPGLPQTDLFGGWAGGRPVNDKTSALLAQKLDNTISKVQNLLREAGV